MRQSQIFLFSLLWPLPHIGRKKFTCHTGYCQHIIPTLAIWGQYLFLISRKFAAGWRKAAGGDASWSACGDTAAAAAQCGRSRHGTPQQPWRTWRPAWPTSPWRRSATASPRTVSWADMSSWLGTSRRETSSSRTTLWSQLPAENLPLAVWLVTDY